MTLYASKDTWIDVANPNDRYGDDDVLRTSYAHSLFQQILLYFPFYGAVPADQHVHRAELQIVREQTAAEQSNLTVYRLWERFSEYAEMVHLGGLKEAEEPFATFQMVCL